MDTTTPSSQFGKLGHFARRRPGIVILVVLLVLLCTVVFYGAAAVLFSRWAGNLLPGPDWTLGQFPDPYCVESEGCLARLTSAYADFFYFLDGETVIYDRGDHFAIRQFVDNKFAPQELGRIEYSQHLQWAFISPDKSHLAACFVDDSYQTVKIQIWDIPSRQLLFQDVPTAEHWTFIKSINFSWDNRLLAISYELNHEYFVEIWDLQRKSKQIVMGNYGAFSPDNRSIAMLSDEQTLSLSSLEDFEVRQTFAIPDLDEKHHAEFPTLSPDGQWLAVNLASYDNNDTIALWHLPDGELRHQLVMPGGLRCQPVFSPDSLRLATCTSLDFGAIYLEDGPISTIMPGGKGPLSIWQSTSFLSIISIWKVDNGGLLQRNQFPSLIGGGFSLSNALDFSPDGAKMGFGVGSSGYVVIDTYYGLKRP